MNIEEKATNVNWIVATMEAFESGAKRFSFDEAENKKEPKFLSVMMASWKRCFRKRV